MKVTALAGGVGGAKLLVGLARLPDVETTAVVNTGDDAVVYGVHVSPDVDICTYWLAGIADVERGWGIAGDTFTVMDALRPLGMDAWFSLGDRDFATCIYRTERLRTGATLSQTTDEIRRALGVRARILPMTDDPVMTRIVTADGRIMDFQEYFVRERHEPEIADVLLDGIAAAHPGPEVRTAIEAADVVVVCPSNPIVSIGPILALRGVRDVLRAHPRVIAVSPIVRGVALKGPADRMLAGFGVDPSASGVASLYADFVTTFVVDASDPGEAPRVDALGVRPLVLDTIMDDAAASEALATGLVAA